MGGWQGFAKVNTLNLNSFGVGTSFVAPELNITNSTRVFYNDSPDTMTCDIYKDGILECTSALTEYCTPASMEDNFTAPFCQGREGQWLNTYSIKSISVLEGFEFECPSPPPGFCESTTLLTGPPIQILVGIVNNFNVNAVGGGTRRLSGEEGEILSHSHSCPIMAAQMQMND